MVNWLSAKFLYSKFYWQNISLHQSERRILVKSYARLHLTLVKDDSNFLTLPAAAVEVVSNLVKANLLHFLDQLPIVDNTTSRNA